jgi:fumarate reductase flavoprotein subunit
MEMVQYHPTGLPLTGILIIEAARSEGGWLLNNDGYRFLQDYDLGKPTPTPVLRSTELGPSRLPMVRELCLKYENFDPVKEPIRVHPVQHYMMGGVHTDINGATP